MQGRRTGVFKMLVKVGQNGKYLLKIEGQNW
jgi:hypothetical protein